MGPNPKKGPFSELKGVKDNINNIIILFKKHPKVGVMARKIATDMGIELMAFTPLKTMNFIAHSLRQLHNFLHNREILVRNLVQLCGDKLNR